MELALWTYLLTLLIPINGLILIGIRAKVAKNRKILMAAWRFSRVIRSRRNGRE